MKKYGYGIATGIVIGLVVAITLFASRPTRPSADGNVIRACNALEKLNSHVIDSVKSLSEIIEEKIVWVVNRQGVLMDTEREAQRIRLDLLEKALAPHSAKEAGELFNTSIKTRNGALLYAILDPQIRDQKMASEVVEEGSWVIGLSSPWVSSMVIDSEKQLDDSTTEFLVRYHMSTSTGGEGPYFIKLTVKKFDDNWLITDYEYLENGEASAS
ncbi:hypothetical protein HFN20_25025 [Paenibacillus dendritiformis]|uniref:hypothetical protein n=1 Tax=Paenibacillus dendritiformis TaxID=130049 RepID=UPI00143CC6BD|nr:hypothetical protein [Paenibacillus dendritiformis]NKI24418.1 hypothetical protein [Paenibacillus dendritiformis]NRG00592.1 hypothetical protein [Paenibacillus dendritiformis]